jgi:hypothetical protein
MRLIRKTPRAKKNFSSLIRGGVDTRLFVLEEVVLLGGVMMGPEGASSIKVLGMWWRSSDSGGLLFLFLFTMNSFHLCKKKKQKKKSCISLSYIDSNPLQVLSLSYGVFPFKTVQVA